MWANEKKNEDVDEMVKNDADTSDSLEIDRRQDNCKLIKTNIASAENEKELEYHEDEKDSKLNNKINGGSDSEWSSSSSSSSSSLSDEKSVCDNPENVDSEIVNDVNVQNSSPSPHLSNNISSHCDDSAEKSSTNCDLNGDALISKDTDVDQLAIKNHKKISFGIKTSVNGLRGISSRKVVQNEVINNVNPLVPPEEDDENEESPEVRAEYAQYLGLKPSVKFKCSRCGTKNFSTIALLQEHIASCSGQVPLTAVTSVSPVNSLHKCDATEPSGMATNLRITRKVFLCSSCGTYYQSYNLYLHMREVHNKQICLFCLSMFCHSQQLSDHLIEVHNLKLGKFSDPSQIRNAFKGSFYITCCMCNRMFCDEERFDEHKCDIETEVHPTQDVSCVTDEKKLPCSDEESSESPLTPVNHSPECEKVEEPEERPKPELGNMEIEPAPSPDQENHATEESTIPNESANSLQDDISNENDNVDMSINKSPEEDRTQLQPDPDTVMNANEVNANYENRSIKDDSSDSETLNALFDRNEEPEEKVSQPLTMALMLDDAVAALSPQTIIKECVRTSCTSCLYCSNALYVAVNSKQLINHLLSEHRYKPTKNEDESELVTQKLESSISELEEVYMNATSNEFDGTFACFQCSFNSTLLKELCAHRRKTHQMNIFLCIVCKCNFLFYSELLCHECPGEYSYEPYSLRFRCCFCSLNHIPSAFRLMVHLRKFHKACDFCLSRHNDQYELFSHMTKQHKMHHRCYKCNLAYRSRNDINKHLFWKHGTESVLCKKCLQKKWPHAYHFCIPASAYTCEECNRVFSRAVALTVHRRAHTGEFPFGCECQQRFISKKLLAAHQRRVHQIGVKEEAANASNGKKENRGSDSGISNEERVDNEKKREKKKRKKSKMNEKPLLDELPPLNLSSESDESGSEEPAKIEMPQKLPSPPSVEEVPSPVTEVVPEVVPEETEKVESPPPSEPVETIEKVSDDFIERALNCLLIEHSYCIPDSIFHSESIDNSDSKSKTPDAHANKNHDKSCCKSTTPRKRKRNKKNSSAGESSSTASSSDSDSSSSSCGSNCSCNRSNSNCSSSSSASEYSTTPEKKKSKSKDYKKAQRKEDKATEEQREQLFLMDARESDLETDISTADEDFYEERPCYVPPPLSDKKVEYPPPVPEPEYEENTPVILKEEVKSRRNKEKKKKRKRIKLNLSGRIPPNCNPLKTNGSSLHLPPVSVPRNEFVNEVRYHYNEEKPLVQSNANMQNCVNTDASLDETNSGRLSKRKRVKNKFYGYSSSEESREMSVKAIPKKRVLTKKSNPKNRQFVGIRAKQLPPLPKRLSISVPFTPVTATQPLEYKSSMPNYNPYQSRYSSSEDSDSDEKRHTLVINIPAIKEKISNNYQPPPYSDDSASSNSYASSPRAEAPQPPIASFNAPTNSSNTKLYCYCQCPYDEVSQMIACDGPNCKIEWFHFECVGIMIAPKGKWYCPSCRRFRENVSRFV